MGSDLMNDIERLEKELKQIKANKKKERNFLATMVKIVFFSTFLFVIAVFALIWFKSYEPTALIEWWFKIMVGELMVAGAIKIADKFKKSNDGGDDNV